MRNARLWSLVKEKNKLDICMNTLLVTEYFHKPSVPCDVQLLSIARTFARRSSVILLTVGAIAGCSARGGARNGES